MQLIEKDGVTLAYEDITLAFHRCFGSWGGCDHASLDA